MREPFRKKLSEIPIEEAHGGTGSRQLILSKTDSVSDYFEAMTKGYLKVGADFDWHAHDGLDEFFLVWNGIGKIEFKDKEPFDYAEGELIYIPANVEHKISALGDVDNEFFFVRIKA